MFKLKLYFGFIFLLLFCSLFASNVNNKESEEEDEEKPLFETDPTDKIVELNFEGEIEEKPKKSRKYYNF